MFHLNVVGYVSLAVLGVAALAAWWAGKTH